MRRKLLLIVVAGCVWTAAAALADSPPDAEVETAVEADTSDIETRARNAERVVVGTVESVYSTYDRNEAGDDLIVSRGWLRVREVIKGEGVLPGQGFELEVEGGTVGDVTLSVSDTEPLTEGEEAIVFVTRERGRLVPVDRGRGVLQLDAEDRVVGSGETLDELRSRMRGQ